MSKDRRYYWNMSQISDKIKLLEELLPKETNPQKKLLIQKDIKVLKDFIREMEEAKLPPKTPILLDNYNNIKDCLDKSTFFWKEFIKFYEILDEAFFNDDYIETLDLPKMTLSNDDILSLTHDFYKSLNPFIFKNFMKHFSGRFNHIKFSNSSIDYSGLSVCLSNRDESYIEIVKDNTIEDVITSIHEYAHSTSSSINYNHINNVLFMEFDTLFMELIAQDYLKSVTKNKGIPILRYNNLVENYLNSDDIHDLISLISAEKEQAPFTSNEILKRVALNKCSIKPYDVDTLLSENYSDLTNYNYLLDYILAVELYEIYKKDKEKALYLLQKIILLDNNDNEQYYSNIKRLGIDPNLSTAQFQRETVLELKRALKKNRPKSK